MLKGIDLECALAMKGYKLADARMRIIIAMQKEKKKTGGEEEHRHQS